MGSGAMPIRAGIFAGLLALGAASAASATVITFDEFPADDTGGAMPSNRYDFLGVHYIGTDDDGSIGGISEGDPGNWNLEGTNGAHFSGFNGASYSATFDFFAGPVNGFSLDASRSQGSQAGDTLTLTAFLGGSTVGTQTITFGDINTWTTVSFAGSLDEVTLQGNGLDFHPFGVDNVQFDVAAGVPEPAAWALMLGGFGLAGAALRRRAARTAA